MMMDVKAQGFGFIKVLAFALLFIIFFALALAPFVTVGLGVSDLSIFGGFGAWLVGAMNFWFLLAFVLVVIVALVYGFSEG